MSPNELSSDAVREGLAVVRAEFEGSFQAVRRPRRALVRFVEYVPENQSVYVKMPAWSSEAVALRVADLPPELALKVTTQPDYRAYAQVNLGTESADALYVADWEYDL
ncbi:hypothetical protein JOE38_001238 [Clavibacter michiganensis]|uniref:hypothetical protein n=1 Tax=Clavibacter michiganensis TaxID=28447 RepID=UPI00195B444C|nr:hypothetical protein [Clavibacter michiganensis]MBM7411415.1 hypothetical protein [Clavibacter michiganensis]